MANLLSIAELACRTINPNPTPSQIAQFVETAKVEYAASLWILAKEEEMLNGFFDIPSSLLTRIEMEVKNNEIDASELKTLNVLSGDRWLADVGGLDCECHYIKSTLNQEKILCDDDSAGNAKTYYVVGKKIVFPRGTHSKKIPIIYANTGSELDDHMEVDDYAASKVREKLQQLYGNKFPEDKTINNSINN